MKTNSRRYLLPALLLLVGLFIIMGISYIVLNYGPPAPAPEVTPLVLLATTPRATSTPTQESTMTATATSTTVATNTPRPTEPPQGIIYALSPDINSVGWIQSDEAGNHFGESYMYTGLREGKIGRASCRERVETEVGVG